MTSHVNLSEQDLQSALEADVAYEEKIPILKRRADAPTNNETDGVIKEPICVIVVGMAGSGKTTLMAQLQKSLGLNNGEKGDEVKDVSVRGSISIALDYFILIPQFSTRF